MSKRKVHKFKATSAVNYHVCGDRSYRYGGDCCSRYWRSVTCKRCLAKKRRRK